MARGATVRFQHWVAGTMLLLVLLLTGTFLWLVLGKIAQQAQGEAEASFEHIAQSAFSEINEVLQKHRRYVEMLAAFSDDPSFGTTDAQADALARSLLANPELESVAVAWSNDDLLFIDITLDDTRYRPLGATPPGARYAVVRMQDQPDGQPRKSHVRFAAADGTQLAQQDAPSDYRPSQRPWLRDTLAKGVTHLSAPLISPGYDGIRLTVAAPLRNGLGVVTTNVSLRTFDHILGRLNLSPNSMVVVVDDTQTVLALRTNGTRYGHIDAAPTRLVRLRDAGSPLMAQLAKQVDAPRGVAHRRVTLDQRPFIVATHAITPVPGRQYRILVLAPMDDFTATVSRSRQEALVTAAVMLAILLPLAWLGTRRVSIALVTLARNSERIRQFDLSPPPQQVRSFVHEIQVLAHAQEVTRVSIAERTAALESARQRLAHLVRVGISLSREREHHKLLQDVAAAALDITDCPVIILRLRDEHDVLRTVANIGDPGWTLVDIPMHDPATGKPWQKYMAAQTAWGGKTIVVDDVQTETVVNVDNLRQANTRLATPIRSVLSVPMSTPEGRVLGVLMLANARDPVTRAVTVFDTERVQLVEALASQAAVALDNQNLAQAQQKLLDSIIRLLANAIDAKSPYTGGHCERVPELAFMLAEEATRVDEGPLADFGFRSEEEWREFRVGAWLHDCGKVTTPEYVVDKATKLETIYNRIHEVRTRFEVLLRDARIAALEAILGGTDRATAWATCATRERQLQDDFAFVAASNIGSEFMAPDHIARIQAMAAQTWTRHFDDRLGLSHAEAERVSGIPAPELPAIESLLADKPGHIVPREHSVVLDQCHGFQMNVPQHLYHHGEIHNLCIVRGTLNEEERFKINEHIMHTIVMLESMPFPQHLRRVPEYAGTHHETLLGTGYPRKLDASQLSVPARIMAIADIFEALTASDRPYKRAKTLSESIHILHRFKQDRHIDPVLFDLFLSSGVYRRYAERFLQPTQIDAVDVARYLG